MIVVPSCLIGIIMTNNVSPGMLYVVSTPIGNLRDITLRAIDTLKDVDVIAAEDTRNTAKLLMHYGITTPTTSYHRFNIREKTQKLIDLLLSGKDVAIVSDAGTPGISDPGHELIEACIANNIKVVGIPGANAMLNALVISGLPTERFAFEGFPPREARGRLKLLRSLKSEPRTMVFYESPHRIVNTLEDMRNILGDRRGAIIREATKVFEEVIRGSLSEIIQVLSERALKGEFVIVIEGLNNDETESYDISNKIPELLRKYTAEGLSDRDAAKAVAEELGVSKREVYQKMLVLKGINDENL